MKFRRFIAGAGFVFSSHIASRFETSARNQYASLNRTEAQMDLSALMALVERCAPGVDARELIPIVRAASGFENLALTIDGRKPIKILATSKDEAIALAMQAKVAHKDARLGIAGLTFDDLDKTGVSVSEAFDACPSLRVAARVHGEQGRGVEKLGVSNATLPAKRSADGDIDPLGDHALDQTPRTVEQEPPSNEPWDVFGRPSASSLLVYRQTLRARRDQAHRFSNGVDDQ
ncbi:MAG: hypothetical protein ACR652_11020 [Methylocystis sp.]|uniref:hypothetical protein n=1 Tax=Methylocystis sp. TaxID=1911079 RepID=UPI003DA1D7E7